MNARMQRQFHQNHRSVHGPGWRNKAARKLADSLEPNAASPWGLLTIELAKFYALIATGPAGIVQADEKYPTLGAAFMLEAESEKTEVMKLMILADSPPNDIAKQVGVDAAVVNVWEQLFFDARGMQAATDWLSTQVIEAERKAGNSALAARMKLALTAGADGVDAILAMDEAAPVDEAEKLFQRKLALSLKFDDALSMITDSDRNRLKFVELYVELHKSEKQLALAEKKLAARCAADRQRSELSKMRLAAAREQAALKGQARQPKAERRRQAQAQREAEQAQLEAVQQAARLAEESGTALRIAESPLMQLARGPAKRQPELPPEPLPSVSLPAVPLPAVPLPAVPLPAVPASPELPLPMPPLTSGVYPEPWELPDWETSVGDPEFDSETAAFDNEWDAVIRGYEYAQGGA